MKSRILPLLFFIFSLQAFTQDSGFRLKDYKYRTPKFQALSINLSFSGSTASRIEEFAKNSSKSFNLAPSQLLYTKIISTNKRLHQTDLYFTPSIYYSNYKGDGQDLTSNIIGTSFGWERSDRYYKSNQVFFEVGNNLTSSIGRNKYTDTVRSDKSKHLTVNNTITLGIGRGRIERVQDAQMALFILNDLGTKGLLSAPVTPEKAYAFAALITDINNQRIFDFRRKRIYELTRIDSFLRNSGLTPTTDIRHFTTLNDNWSLAINSTRLSGAAWYVRLKPTAVYSHSNAESKFISVVNSSFYDGIFIGLEPEVGYERHVSKSLKWQHNIGASLSFRTGRSWLQNSSLNGGLRSDYSYTMSAETWKAKAFYGIGFFPNNRTQLSGNLLFSASRIHDRLSTYYELRPSVLIATTYFLGYRTYLSGNLYLNYLYDRYKVGSSLQPAIKHFQSSLSVGFSHILF